MTVHNFVNQTFLSNAINDCNCINSISFQSLENNNNQNYRSDTSNIATLRKFLQEMFLEFGTLRIQHDTILYHYTKNLKHRWIFTPEIGNEQKSKKTSIQCNFLIHDCVNVTCIYFRSVKEIVDDSMWFRMLNVKMNFKKIDIAYR